MNICFYTHFEAVPTIGGTERTTYTLARHLSQKKSIRCFSVFELAGGESHKEEAVFESVLQLPRSNNAVQQLARFLCDNAVSVLISQGEYFRLPEMVAACKLSNCKLVLAHHSVPGFDLNCRSRETLLRLLKHGIQTRKNFGRLLWSPVRQARIRKKITRNYRYALAHCAAVVLLSPSFTDGFLRFAHLRSETNKLRAIPNALSFETSLDPIALSEKQKEVLIVSRLEEIEKRLTAALRIWKSVEQDPAFRDWSLRIVGEGTNLSDYKRIASRYALQRVVFEGRKAPVPFFRKASLFMMTSVFEGLPLTLTEAQQMGCVPVAFDSYPSLRDIIDHEHNGMIVENGNISAYVATLTRLMADGDFRTQLAKNALVDCQRYSQDRVGDMWCALFEELISSP